MFLNKNYIFIGELAKKLGITINNFSCWYSRNPELIGTDIIKLGDCSFVRKDSAILGEFYEAKIKELQLTDISNKVPLSYLKAEYYFNLRHPPVLKLGEIVEIAGKKFFAFDTDFAYKNRRKTWYPMTKVEYANGNYSDCLSLDVARNHLIVLY